MNKPEKNKPKTKSKLHPRNQHRERYDFKKLVATFPALKQFVKQNDYNDTSIDFFNPDAVKSLNKALLMHYYDLEYWDIPKGYLCPPIPGRADYLHYVADLLADCNGGKIPKGKKITCLDIGTGANCVYPIIGNKEYGWLFIGTEVDPIAVEAARKIVFENTVLREKVELRLQTSPRDIFYGIIRKEEEYFDLTICNPPFHASVEEAEAASRRKNRNLKNKKNAKPILNFGGHHKELWCEGGELQFIKNMIWQSQKFATSSFLFSTLVSKESNLKKIYDTLHIVKASDVRTMPMGQGNKISRVVAWTFLSRKQQQVWAERRWG